MVKWQFEVEAEKVTVEPVGRGSSSCIKITASGIYPKDIIEAIGEDSIMDELSDSFFLNYMKNFETKDIVESIGMEELLNTIGKDAVMKHFGIELLPAEEK